MSWTELDNAETAAGAQWTDFQGERLPRTFGSLEREWQAVRRGVGLVDGRTRALLSLTGSDRRSFMQGMITNKVATLADGQGTYAALLTIQGRIVSDLYVYALADRLLLDVPAWRREAVREALERFIIADDVEFEDLAIAPLLAVEGPGAAALLATVSEPALETLAPYAIRAVTIGNVPVHAVAVTQSGEAGFRVLGPVGAAVPLWQQLTAAGATPIGLDALQVLRLEAGIPWHGIDMDAETLVMEVDLDGAIAFGKGCYLGQEVVERVAARGHVNRRLCGLTARAGLIPPAGTPLTHDGKDVGHLTSAARSPALDSVIALGYVQRAAAEPGTTVQAHVGEQSLDMTITARPFYRPPSLAT